LRGNNYFVRNNLTVFQEGKKMILKNENLSKLHNSFFGSHRTPYIIAEMSGNHNQSLDRALEIVDAAAKTGVDALKIQTYTPDTMTLDLDRDEFHISDPNNLWKGNSLYGLYKQAYTPWEWHSAIFDRARKLGIVAFSTPFDESAVEFLESLNTPFYKISSFENTDLPLIRRVAATKKPVIISTGMATIAELDEAVQAAREAGCDELVLLKCTSTYPASPENTNLLTIPHMRELFNCEIGISDHTLGIGVSVAASALGATVIEKHFTISRSEGGVDSAFSMEPMEMKALVEETKAAWYAMGSVRYGATNAEKGSLAFRRSLYVTQDLKVGDVLGEDSVRAIRPGLGLPTKYLPQIIGRTLRQDVKRGTPLSWNLLL